MKKTLSLLLTLVLCLSLCACGSGNSDTPETPETTETTAPEEVLITKDEMLANAVEIDNYEAEFASNKLRAEEKYVGNNYLVTGNIVGIESDHIEIQSIVDNSVGFGSISVALPKEDIMELTTGQRVQIVGKFESFNEDKIDMGYGYSETVYNGVMTNGYLVSDTFEISGTLIFYYKDLIDIDGRTHHNYGDEEYWSFGLDVVDDNIISVAFSMAEAIPVEHVKGQNVETITISGQTLESRTKITVSAKIIGNKLADVELISVDE